MVREMKADLGFLVALMDLRLSMPREVWEGICAEAGRTSIPFSVEVVSEGALDQFHGLPVLGVIAAIFNQEVMGDRRPAFPLINVSNSSGPISGVGNLLSNDVAIGRSAARHLLERGHRELLGIGMPGRVFSNERLAGFREVAEQAGVRVRVKNFELWSDRRIGNYWDPGERYRRTAEILAPWIEELAPDGAIFTTDEWIARSVSFVLRDGFPEQEVTTGLLTVEGAPGGSLVPGLFGAITSVVPPFRRIGAQALLWMRDHGGDRDACRDLLVRFEPEGIREAVSTCGPACGHAPTARAIRWAWQRVQSGDPARTRELASFLRVSTRTLDRQFLQHTGTTAHAFLLDLRLNRAKQLLRHRPDWSIDRISATCGFSKQSNFSHRFKARFGETPGAWRRRAGSPS